MPPCYPNERSRWSTWHGQRTTKPKNNQGEFIFNLFVFCPFHFLSLPPPSSTYHIIAPSKMPSASTEDPDRPSEIEPSEIEIEAVARKMFYGGCALLPWLWLVNIIYFRKLYFSPECPPGVKKWVGRSSIGFLVVTTLWIIWCIIFQTTYKSWGTALLVVPVDDGSW